MRKNLLTLDIVFILLVALIGVALHETENQKILSTYFVPFMLTAYYAGRYATLYVLRKYDSKK